jgi:hypothetical protein
MNDLCRQDLTLVYCCAMWIRNICWYKLYTRFARCHVSPSWGNDITVRRIVVLLVPELFLLVYEWFLVLRLLMMWIVIYPCWIDQLVVAADDHRV